MATSNKDLMTQARATLKGKWGFAIAGFVIYVVVLALASCIPLGSVIIGGALAMGLSLLFLGLIRKTDPKIETLFDGFKSFINALVAYLLTMIFTILWMLLLIVPGIIAALSYSMTFYILADNKDMSGLDAIKASKAMMMGYKWKLFCLFCRFIGWGLLGILSIGIGFIWIGPYVMTSVALFYEDIKNAKVTTAQPS
jgi:uncharacterized membrane protein